MDEISLQVSREAAAEGQTESDAGSGIGRFVSGLAERLKQATEIFARDSRARIGERMPCSVSSKWRRIWGTFSTKRGERSRPS